MFEVTLFVVAFLATLLSSMSGSGTSIINIPVFIWLGLSFPSALSLTIFSSVFWVLPASYNYLKGKVIEWKFLILYALIGLVGAYIGVRTVLSIDQRLFEIGIGTLIIFLVAYSYFRKELGLEAKATIAHSKIKVACAYLSALVLGFYESIFGSGNGILFSFVSFYTKGFDFTRALGYYYAIAFAWCAFAATLYIREGYFNIKLAIPVVLGGVLGGWCGSKLGRFKGNKFIKIMFVGIGSILGLKLILGI